MVTVNLSAGAIFGLGAITGAILGVVILVIAAYAISKKKR